MKIQTGKEKSDGTFSCRVIGENQESETVKEALQRVAERFLGHRLGKHKWHETWGRLGKHDEPTEYLPALFVGSRLFEVATEWNGDGGWRLA